GGATRSTVARAKRRVLQPCRMRSIRPGAWSSASATGTSRRTHGYESIADTVCAATGGERPVGARARPDGLPRRRSLPCSHVRPVSPQVRRSDDAPAPPVPAAWFSVYGSAPFGAVAGHVGWARAPAVPIAGGAGQSHGRPAPRAWSGSWSWRRDSNSQPSHYKWGALPI